MSVFVINCESIEGSETVGVYLNVKLAKVGAKEYIDTWYADKMKKKQVKESDVRKILFMEDTKEHPAIISMCEVPFEMPKGKGKREKKDPMAPKKGLSAYMIFAKENREAIKSNNPEASFGEMGKAIGNAWKELSDKEKLIYNNKSEEDKKRYKADMSNYV